MRVNQVAFLLILLTAICAALLSFEESGALAVSIKGNKVDNSLREQESSSTITKDQELFVSNDSPTSSPIDWSAAATSAINTTVSDWDNLPQWAQIVMSVAIMVLGLINVYYGYRFLPFSFFMIGGFIVFIIMLGILSAAISDSDPNKTAIVFGVSVACWVIAGLLFVILSKVAVFFLGAAVGVVIAIVLNPICLHYVWPANPQGNLYIWMSVFGLITGIITCYFERVVLIVSTALTGSLFVILGIGGIAGNLPLLSSIVSNPDNAKWEWWAYIGGWAALVITGLIVQLCYTAKDKDKEDNSKHDATQ